MHEAPAGQVGPGYTWPGPAQACQAPFRRPSRLAGPTSPTSSPETQFPPSSFPSLCLQTCWGFCQEALSPWQSYTPASKTKPFGNCLLGSWASACLVLAQDIPLCRNKAGSLPGAWAQLLAALLLLLAAGFSLAARQLRSSGASPGTLGSGAAPAIRHSHRPGVYHRGGYSSPTGRR